MAKDESMLQLGYRALFSLEDVRGGYELVEVLDREFRNWARDLVKGDDPLPTWDGRSKLSLAEGVTVEGAEDDSDRSGIYRRMYRLDNRSGGRLFRIDSYAIGHGDPNEPQLVLVEGLMEARDREEAIEEFGTPRLVRAFIGTRHALVGEMRLTDVPQPVMAGTERDVYEEIMDAGRALPVTVAVSPAREADEKWTELIGNLVRNSIGMSLTYTVPFDSAEAFNELLPEGFNVAPGMARTFLPNVDLDNPSESLRHRAIGSRALSEAIDPHAGELRLKRYLLQAHARGVRRSALAASLPKEVRRAVTLVNRALAKQQRSERVQDEVAAAPVVVPQPVARKPVPAPSPPEPAPSHGVPARVKQGLEQVKHWAAVGRAVFDFFTSRFGEKAIGLDPVEEIDNTYLALDDRAAEVDAVWKAYAEESDDLENTIVNLKDVNDEHLAAQEELQLALASVQEEADQLQRRLDYYRTQIIEFKKPELLHARLDAQWDPPVDIDQLVDWITPNLGEDHTVANRVEFTGNRDHLEVLRRADPADAWAGRIWGYVHALHDYVELKEKGEYTGNFHTYLTDDSAPGVKTSPSNYAPTESETVKERPSWREARVFPVPKKVTRARKIFMDAHFKIPATSGVHPRVHIHDDTGRTGKVYVGYIGPHLPNTLTN